MQEIKILQNVAKRFTKKCRNVQDKEDLYQQTCLIYLEHKDKYDSSRGSFEGFASHFIYKKLLTYFESKEVRTRLTDYSELEHQEAPRLTEAAIDIRLAISRLSVKEKRLLASYNRKAKKPCNIRVSKKYTSQIEALQNKLYK